MEQVKKRRLLHRLRGVIAIGALAAVFAVFSSDAVNGRWAFYLPETITVNGEKVTVDDTLARNEYEREDFEVDGRGRMRLKEGNYLTGVDVSSHQGKIDWAAVAGDGIEFAMLRVGFRGYQGEGSLHLDERFRENAAQARANGLEVGAYFFSQAVTVEEAEEEAEFLLKALKGIPITLPVAYDWEVIPPEESGAGGARTDGLDQETATACALAFCAKVREAGYRSAVYCNDETGYFSYDVAQLQEEFLWYANHREGWPDYYYSLDMWQYTSAGKAAGIEGEVDLDLLPLDTEDRSGDSSAEAQADLPVEGEGTGDPSGSGETERSQRG